MVTLTHCVSWWLSK